MARILTITLNPALDLTVESPVLTLGTVNRVRATQLEPAGKGINVARVLARLGHTVCVSGLLGDLNPEPFERLFAVEKLADHFVRVPGDNRINTKIAEPDGRVTELNGPGFTVDADALHQLKSQLEGLLGGQDALVIAGSLPSGMPAAGLCDLINFLKAAGKPVWLDTSGTAFSAGLEAMPFGVKPNRDELAEWAGEPLANLASLGNAARQLQQSGINNVAVSMGANGVLWLESGAGWLASSPKVDVISTVCAGDTLLAGLLHGQLSGQSPQNTLRQATALAAESVRHIGVGDPDAADFHQLQQQTRITPWPGADVNGEMPL